MSEHRTKHRLEFALMRFMGVLLSKTPYRFALLVGWKLAVFGHYVLRYRKQAAFARIREVFPDYSEADVRRVAWLSWRNFIFNIVDIFRLEHADVAWIDKHVAGAAEARAHVQTHVATGQGGILASPHMGAAELAAVMMQRFGVPVFLITGRQSNALVDERLNEMRAATGIPLVQKGSSLLRSVIRRLKGGEVLAFLADLRVDDGIVVDFLGTKASVAPGMALFASQTQVPILPVILSRESWTRHRIQFHPTVVPDSNAPKREDQQRMTQEVFDIIDRAIREMPEQWFWFNKSWILDPPGTAHAEAAEPVEGEA